MGSDKLPAYKHAIAGASAGAVSTLTCYPLDLVIKRFQSNAYSYTSTLGALKTIRTGGFSALFKGITPALGGYITAWGSFMWFYNQLKERLRALRNVQKLSMPDTLACSTFGGVAGQLICNPIWVVKTNMQLETYKGINDIVARRGLTGFYKGLVPGLFGTCQGGIQFMFYEELRYMLGETGEAESRKLSHMETVCVSFCSRTTSLVLTYPYKVVRTRLMHFDGPTEYIGVVNTCVRMTREEGWRGFYRGLTTTLIRTMPANVVTFLVYEQLKVWLQDGV